MFTAIYVMFNGYDLLGQSLPFSEPSFYFIFCIFLFFIILSLGFYICFNCG